MIFASEINISKLLPIKNEYHWFIFCNTTFHRRTLCNSENLISSWDNVVHSFRFFAVYFLSILTPKCHRSSHCFSGSFIKHLEKNWQQIIKLFLTQIKSIPYNVIVLLYSTIFDRNYSISFLFKHRKNEKFFKVVL